jgi:hypothetical protein
MRLALRRICLAVGLLLILAGCVEDNRHIRPASEAAAGSGGPGKVTFSWGKVLAESYDFFMATVPGGDSKRGQPVSNYRSIHRDNILFRFIREK